MPRIMFPGPLATAFVSLALSIAVQGRFAARPIAPEVAELCNLLKNGGFEQGEATPASWGRYPGEDKDGNRHLRDTSVFHSGTASGLLWSVTPHPPGKPGMQWNQYGVAVEGGSTIIASLWIKTEGVEPIGAGIHFYDADRNHLGFVKIPGPKRAEEWTYIRQSVPVPREAKTMGFACYAGDEGKTWYDDVAAIGTPNATAVRATPTLDGKLNEDCWSKDRAITAFAVHTGQKLPTQNPRAWLAYDDSNLYVAFRCPHPKAADLRARATQRDQDAWLDDSIEVFLDPDHDHGGYFQFVVNCLGVLRDSRGIDKSWDCKAQAAVQRRAEAWTVELAIPFDDLELGLDVGTVWGINLVRNDRVHGETSTWSLGGFHNAARFGNVSLKPDLGRFFRRDLARRLETQKRRRELLLKEMRAAELPPQTIAEASNILRPAQAKAADLRRIASGEAELPEGGWDAVRIALASLDDTLLAARAAALEGVFAVPGTDSAGGFRVALEHSLQKVRRSGPVHLVGEITREVHLDAARDETESFQLVIIPAGRALEGVAVEAKALTGPGGAIPMQWHRVGYVETATPGYATEYVGWWPDPLLPPGPLDVAGDERQPLWFTVSVPPEAKPGLYQGHVTIRHGERAVAVPVKLRVRNFRLPRPGTLATAFGLYAPFLSRWWWGREPYRSHMPIEMFARWCEFMGRHRLTPKNIAREYITTSHEANGFQADLTALQQTVVPLAPKYFAPYSFCLHRLPTSSAIRRPNNKHTPGNAEEAVKAFAAEWQRLGLPPQVYIYGYDEPRPEDYPFLREAYTKVHAVAPQYPIMQTISDRSPDALVGFVDIWCPLTPSMNADFYKQRLKAGDKLWTYVCCGPRPPHANFFVDEPAIDHRVVFWQARQAGATGFLYWGICIWDGLPNAASGEKCFPEVPIHLKDHMTYKSFKVNGDGLLVYPGADKNPLSSIRLEVIRDGIEDYEYLALLSRLVEKAKKLPRAQRPKAELLARAEELCVVPEGISRTITDYTKEPEVLFQRRREVADALEALTKLLGEEDGAG